MDTKRTGSLIRKLRTEKKLTQKALADIMHISDKTVSKWECGAGCPDVSLLNELSNIFGVNMQNLLVGELDDKEQIGGNMKNTNFYVCPTCGNLIAGTSEADIFCCGKKLEPAEIKKAEPEEKLSVELIDNDYFISGNHDMTKEHYITFVALLTGDTLIMKKQYPEWDLQTRIPRIAHGKLIWHCNKHGVFWQVC